MSTIILPPFSVLQQSFHYFHGVGKVPGESRKEAIQAIQKKLCQHHYLYKTGKRRKVWRARWGEPIVLADRSVSRVPRNEIIAEVCDVPTRRQAQMPLDEKLRNFNLVIHKLQALDCLHLLAEHRQVFGVVARRNAALRSSPRR
jgi:hypothetical protein